MTDSPDKKAAKRDKLKSRRDGQVLERAIVGDILGDIFACSFEQAENSLNNLEMLNR